MSPVMRALTVRPLPLVEREAPLDVLLAELADARQGQGRLAVVQGEAGIGKTSLLRALAREVGDCDMLWGGCEALSTSRPFGPLHDMIDALGREVAAALEDETTPVRLFPLLLASLQRARRPTLMIVEDIHWADQATLDLIKFLGRRVGALRLLLVISHRTDEAGGDYPIARVLGDLNQGLIRRIPLVPLSASAVETMARKAGRETSGDLFRITHGNPFFITEILASPAEGTETLPPSIRDAVWARVARLDEPARAVLETLSVMPGGASRDQVEVLLDAPGPDAIDTCVRAGMLVEEEDLLCFRHELARQAMLALLPRGRQRTLHARIAADLAQGGKPNDPAILARRMHHVACAGDGAAVLRLAPLAAAHAARVGAHRQAAEHLATAIGFVAQAPPEEAAQLHESWSYEAGLAQIDDAAIAARHQAIALWRSAGRIDKVGLNLRWLSRLHWYRGEVDEAERYADEAIDTLETVAPGPELAMSYSVRSQWHMLNGRTDQAVCWGKRAIELADQLGELEVRVHALNNIGSALLLAGDPEGRSYMEESLALALANDFHEQAARVYTNLAEYAISFKDFELAKCTIAEGIAFDTRYDLDSWLYYLMGCQAQLLMEQGALRQAEALARAVLDRPSLTLVMKLPAATVLGRVRMRLGDPDGPLLLKGVLEDALATKEAQRIVPVRLALAEAAWLAGDMAACLAQVAAIEEAATYSTPWELGESLCWRQRAGGEVNEWPADLPDPRAAELAGHASEAADAWARLGLPYEQALALARVNGEEDGVALACALDLLDGLDASAAVKRIRKIAQDRDLSTHLRPHRRGPYRAARRHPLGLTAKEHRILALLCGGAGNRKIAETLSRSPRTIEHHVSSVLAKLGVHNRMEAMLRVQREPWLLAAPEISRPAEEV